MRLVGREGVGRSEPQGRRPRKHACAPRLTPAPVPAALCARRLQLGRFTLRDEGRTIAIGKVLKIPKKKAGGEE